MWAEGTGVSAAALLSNGTLYASGFNTSGNLGVGNASVTLYFSQVLTAASTPLTGVTRIRPTTAGFAALKSDGALFFTGPNNGCIWGDGSANNAASNNYAAQKQSGVSNFWSLLSTRGYVGVFILKSGLLYACGYNIDYSLGVDAAENAAVPTALLVPLPEGEVPVGMKTLGGINVSNVVFRGSILQSSSGRLFLWGDVQDGTPRKPYPTPIVDFY